MTDLSQRLERAREHVVPSWTPERERAVRARVERRILRRSRLGAASAVVVAAAVVVVGVVGWKQLSSEAPRASQPPAAGRAIAGFEAPLLRLPDGTEVAAASRDAHVEPVKVTPSAALVRLTAGSARFRVSHTEGRVFEVLARNVTVTVVGTLFVVGIEPRGVEVSVEEGRVRVRSAEGTRELVAGQRTFVPTSAGELTAQPVNPAPDVGQSPAPAPKSASPREAVSWQSLAEDGDYAAAFSHIAADTAAVKDEPADLLLAADVARLSGHPERALPWLERVVRGHAADSRAPLGAFTLGRILLDQLGRPREAAAAFDTVRRLAPNGALAQDALAREVESWSRAGDATLARRRAEEYVELYPNGRRLKAVKRLGGLD